MLADSTGRAGALAEAFAVAFADFPAAAKTVAAPAAAALPPPPRPSPRTAPVPPAPAPTGGVWYEIELAAGGVVGPFADVVAGKRALDRGALVGRLLRRPDGVVLTMRSSPAKRVHLVAPALLAENVGEGDAVSMGEVFAALGRTAP